MLPVAEGPAAEGRQAVVHMLAGKRIVVGVDGSAASAAAVRWAVREARLRHLTVHLVCSYHSDARLHAPYASQSWEVHREERHAAARAELDATAELARHRLPPGRLIAELVSEPPVRALLDRSAGAEMLVLGATRPNRRAGQPPLALGPVARICLRVAQCPVVVVGGRGMADEDAGPLSSARRTSDGVALSCNES
jgi:nucleotide-binding universal stress UspA family protein